MSKESNEINFDNMHSEIELSDALTEATDLINWISPNLPRDKAAQWLTLVDSIDAYRRCFRTYATSGDKDGLRFAKIASSIGIHEAYIKATKALTNIQLSKTDQIDASMMVLQFIKLNSLIEASAIIGIKYGKISIFDICEREPSVMDFVNLILEMEDVSQLKKESLGSNDIGKYFGGDVVYEKYPNLTASLLYSGARSFIYMCVYGDKYQSALSEDSPETYERIGKFGRKLLGGIKFYQNKVQDSIVSTDRTEEQQKIYDVWNNLLTTGRLSAVWEITTSITDYAMLKSLYEKFDLNLDNFSGNERTQIEWFLNRIEEYIGSLESDESTPLVIGDLLPILQPRRAINNEPINIKATKQIAVSLLNTARSLSEFVVNPEVIDTDQLCINLPTSIIVERDNANQYKYKLNLTFADEELSDSITFVLTIDLSPKASSDNYLNWNLLNSTNSPNTSDIRFAIEQIIPLVLQNCLDQALEAKRTKNKQKSLPSESEKRKTDQTSHYRDEVYNLRKEMRNKGRTKVQINNVNTLEKISRVNQMTIDMEQIGDLVNDLSEDIAEKIIDSAIRYNNGIKRGFKRIHKDYKGMPVGRFAVDTVHNRYVILCFINGNTIIPYKIGARKDKRIYS